MKPRASLSCVMCLGILLAPAALVAQPRIDTDGAAKMSPAPLVLVVDKKKLGTVRGATLGTTLSPDIGTTLPDVGGGDTVVYATSSIKCGSTIYEVSDGGKGGCMNMPNQQGVYCSGNGGKNWAGATCAKGCDKPKGEGSCTVKSAD